MLTAFAIPTYQKLISKQKKTQKLSIQNRIIPNNLWTYETLCGMLWLLRRQHGNDVLNLKKEKALEHNAPRIWRRQRKIVNLTTPDFWYK